MKTLPPPAYKQTDLHLQLFSASSTLVKKTSRQKEKKKKKKKGCGKEILKSVTAAGMVEGRKDVGVKEVVYKEENDKVSKAFPVLCVHFKSPVRPGLSLFSILRIRAYQSGWWATAEGCFPLSPNLLLQHLLSPALPVTAERTKVSWSCLTKWPPSLAILSQSSRTRSIHTAQKSGEIPRKQRPNCALLRRSGDTYTVALQTQQNAGTHGVGFGISP